MIPIKTLISCILVKERVRPAMMVQPVDHGEKIGSDPNTKAILDEIKILFPELIHSEDYEGNYQGIIISYDNFNQGGWLWNLFFKGTTFDMGKILGYPCYSEFDSLNRNVVYYRIELLTRFEDGSKHQIFGNVCKDQSKIGEFQEIADRATQVLRSAEYARMFESPVQDVYVDVKTITPTMDLIELLAVEKELSQDDKDEIINTVLNLGYSTEMVDKLEHSIQYNNPFHRGVLASFLIDAEYQQYPDEEDIERRELMILDIVGSTIRDEEDHLDKKEQFKLGLLYCIDQIDKDNSVMSILKHAKIQKINSILSMKGGSSKKKKCKKVTRRRRTKRGKN